MLKLSLYIPTLKMKELKSEMNKTINEPLSLIECLNEGFRLYKRSFFQVIPLSFLGIFTILSPLLISWWGLSQATNLFSKTQYFVLANLITALISLLFFGAIIIRLNKNLHLEPCGFIQSILKSSEKYIELLLLAFFYSTIVFFSTILLIIPGIIVGITLMFSFALLYTDDETPFHALVTSHQLVKSYFWRTSILVATIGLFGLLIAFMIISIPIDVSTFFHWSIEKTYWYIFGLFILSNILLVPLFYSILLILLHDLKVRQ